MDSTLLSGIVGGAATLLAAIIALPGIKKRFLRKEKSSHYVQNPNRLSFIKGTWVGSTVQSAGVTGQNMTVELNSKLETSDNLISGTTKVTWTGQEGKEFINVNFEGGFVSENYIRILYHYSSGEIQNYGVMFLLLDASGTTLTGNMIGYGHLSQHIITGITTLKKV